MKEVLRYLKSPKIIILQIANIFASAISNAGKLMVPLFLGYLIDAYEQGRGLDVEPILPIVIGVTIFVFFSEFTHDFLNQYVSYYIGWGIKNDLMEKIVSQEWPFVNKYKKENLFNVLDNDVNVIKGFLSTGLVAIINGILLLIGSTVLMIILNVRLTLYVIVSVPVIWLIFFYFFSKSRKYFKVFRTVIDKSGRRIDETVRGAMLIRVFNAQREEIKKFKEINKTLFNNALRILNMYSYLIPFISLVSTGMYLVVLNFGGEMTLQGELTTGEMTQFVYYTTTFTAPLMVIGFISTAIANAIESSKRIAEVINAPNNFVDGKKEVTKFENMEFDSVFFKFQQHELADYIIEDLSFSFRKGEKIGVLGPTGAGKSLITSLMVRLHDPTKGTIMLNGHDLRSYKIESYRDIVGLVPQQSFLFSETIRENIIFGAEYDKEKLHRIAKICMVHDFVQKMPNKYEEIIGERGSNLSGGQKQRVTLARALYNGGQLLILDDCTSKLDILTERKVIENIRKEFKDVTIVIVAQKIVSVKDCDKIILLDQGRLDAFGAHEQLKNDSFLYKQIQLSQK